jgi:hypothetical protein
VLKFNVSKNSKKLHTINGHPWIISSLGFGLKFSSHGTHGSSQTLTDCHHKLQKHAPLITKFLALSTPLQVEEVCLLGSCLCQSFLTLYLLLNNFIQKLSLFVAFIQASFARRATLKSLLLLKPRTLFPFRLA